MIKRTLNEWLSHWQTHHPTAWDLGLTRLSIVAKNLGLLPDVPEATIITVSGTNGKGSTCALLAEIYLQEGHKVGLFTSPHLIRFNERIVIDGQEVKDLELIEAFEAIEAAQNGTSITYFEAATLAAIYLFKKHACQLWVLEVGLGGRLDASNYINADCAIITSIGLDHQEYLGDTREKIAIEKCGIARAGKPLICSDPAVPMTLFAEAQRIRVDLWCIKQTHSDTPGTIFQLKQLSSDESLGARATPQWQLSTPNTTYSSLPLPALRGAFQLYNAAAALTATIALQTRLPVRMASIRNALVQVDWPGRMQVLAGQPVVVLDVAHNGHAAHALAHALGDMGYFPSTHAVFAMLKDKDRAQVIEILKHRIDHWHLAPTEGDRGLSTQELTETLVLAGVAQKQIHSHDNMKSALVAAQQACNRSDRIVCFGTFSLIATALAHDFHHPS